MAEHALAMMMVLSKRIVEADRHARTGQAIDRNNYIGRELNGRTLGVIGIGNVGGLLRWRLGGSTLQVDDDDAAFNLLTFPGSDNPKGVAKGEATPYAAEATAHEPARRIAGCRDFLRALDACERKLLG